MPRSHHIFPISSTWCCTRQSILPSIRLHVIYGLHKIISRYIIHHRSDYFSIFKNDPVGEFTYSQRRLSFKHMAILICFIEILIVMQYKPRKNIYIQHFPHNTYTHPISISFSIKNSSLSLSICICICPEST